MDQNNAKQILDTIIGQIFGFQNPFSLEQFAQKYAFDIRLPQAVTEMSTGAPTWSQSVNPVNYITMKNSHKGTGPNEDWMLPKVDVSSIQQLVEIWQSRNFTVTERQIESDNVAQSDNIYNSSNVFRSQDIHRSKSILYSDSMHDSEMVAASQRSQNVNYSARVEDSGNVSSSFSVVWSSKISNSMFINDCFDLYECIFCSHITGKKFCIANMQFEEEEYYRIKKMVVEWVLTH